MLTLLFCRLTNTGITFRNCKSCFPIVFQLIQTKHKRIPRRLRSECLPSNRLSSICFRLIVIFMCLCVYYCSLRCMCTHFYCLLSVLVIWSTSAALWSICKAAVPRFLLAFQSLWTEETYAKKGKERTTLTCCVKWGRVSRGPLNRPPRRAPDSLDFTP